MNRGFVAVAVALGWIGGAVQAADQAALAEEAKGLMQKFGGALKEELQAAMKDGGPMNAIAVCNEKAPEIAESVPGDSGWIVGRSSHKLRNPENAADDFTAAAIQEFLERQEAGEAAEQLVKAEVVQEEDGMAFRLVKAIPTGEMCLNCHGGDDVAPEIVDKLAELYPEDQARGFTTGEMRGVFTLKKMVE